MAHIEWVARMKNWEHGWEGGSKGLRGWKNLGKVWKLGGLFRQFDGDKNPGAWSSMANRAFPFVLWRIRQTETNLAISPFWILEILVWSDLY